MAVTRAIAALLLLAGCQEPELAVNSPVPLAGAGDFADSRVRGGDNGLEVIRWSAPCDSSHAVDVLDAAGKGGTLPPETIERLRRNGLMVAEIPTDRLPEVLQSLGGTLADLRHWHGQIGEWRELVRVDLRGGQAIFTGDRVRPLGMSTVRLSMRGWTVPMEDGGLFWFEFVPHSAARDSAALALGSSRDRLRGEAFPEAGLSVVLDSGWSLVLCPDIPAPAPAEESAAAPRPPAEPPPTLGALLLPVERLPPLPGQPPQERTPVFVFIPRLPDALVPLPVERPSGDSPAAAPAVSGDRAARATIAVTERPS